MNTTCPKCRAEYNGKPTLHQRKYWCGSSEWDCGDFYQSPHCVRRERDQILEQSPSSVRRERDQLEDRNRELVERIKRLEQALGEVEAAMIRPASNHRLMQIAGPARQVINIVKQAREAKP